MARAKNIQNSVYKVGYMFGQKSMSERCARNKSFRYKLYMAFGHSSVEKVAEKL